MDTLKQLMNSVEQANNRAEASYWWMKGIDMKQAEELQVADKVKDVLKLLSKVDNITIDIIIQIKNKKQ